MPIKYDIYKDCTLCPRACHADRTKAKSPTDGPGSCRMGAGAVLAKAMLHSWEEPGITEHGAPSGAVFFTGCTMQCVYCQNRAISAGLPYTAETKTPVPGTDGTVTRRPVGIPRSPKQLAQIFLRLQKEGASNIDLVTPTHFLPDVKEALELCGGRLTIPVVYNTGGYERAEIIKEISPYIDYWLPDVKYFDDDTAVRYSRAPRYFETACEALSEMIAASERKTAETSQQKGTDGTTAALRPAKERVIVRHMVLPGQKEDSIRVLRGLKERFGTDRFLISLMSQYTPQEEETAPASCAEERTALSRGRGLFTKENYPELFRRVTTYEYEKVVEEALRLGFDGYRQDRTTAKKEYTPDFDLSGL